MTNEVLAAACIFEGDDAPFADVGFTLAVLQAGAGGPEKDIRLPALRWHGGYCREVRDVTLEEAQAVHATLALLPTVGSGERARSQTCSPGVGSSGRAYEGPR